MSNGFLSMGPDYTPGTTASATGSVLDDILYQLTRPVETEGMFSQAEALFENAYNELSKIQNQVAPEQQADALAEYLRTSGFSSHVVEQTLGIPREEVDAALMAAGYDVTGQPLPEGTLDNELTKTADVFDDSTQVVNMGSVYLGGGRFRDRETGEITYQEGAALNPAYKVGEIYGYEGPLEMKGEAEDDTFGDLISSIFTQSADTVALGKARAKAIEDENKRIAGVAEAREKAAEQAKTGDTTTTTGTGTTTTDTSTTTGTTTGVTSTGDGTITVVDGVDGKDGRDGIDGIDGIDGVDGKDGKDGKDGMTGLITLMMSQEAPFVEQMFSRELFEPKLRQLENVFPAATQTAQIAQMFAPRGMLRGLV